jgi:carbonic anhydrase/acetyltransferase-like protein (isoleucine patch superfamily)
MSLLPFKNKVPKINSDCFIAPNSMVIGDVEIGSLSSVWFGTIVRGDVFHIRIGSNTNIQDNSVVHVTAIMLQSAILLHYTVVQYLIIH